MTENDIKAMGLVLSLDRCIELAQGARDNCIEKMKYTRTPKNAYKKSVEFYESVRRHLERLKRLESETNKG